MTSRIMYQLPLISPSVSQLERLEVLHRMGLRRALGVPQAAPNNAVLYESQSKPLRLAASQRLLLQIGRLRETVAGRALLQRLRKRSESRAYLALNTLRSLGLDLRDRPKTLKPPWSFPSLDCSLTIPHVRAKRNSPLAAMRSLVLEHLETEYASHLQIFTDGSVDKVRGSSAAAFHIPSLKYDWSVRFTKVVSSTMAESVAIEAALKKLRCCTPQPTVIITDSKSALQRLEYGFPTDALSLRSLRLVQNLHSKGFSIRFQWVPSHIGVLGNEIADNLAHTALSGIPVHGVPHEVKQMFRDVVLCHFSSLWSSPHQPCVTKGLKRYQATLLHRVRTDSARTPAWMYKTGLALSPLCSTCGVCGDIEHYLLCCTLYNAERAVLFGSLKKAGVPHSSLQDIVFPRGSQSSRRDASRLLLLYLQDTDLASTW